MVSEVSALNTCTLILETVNSMYRWMGMTLHIKPVVSGVLQRSILGPLCFSLFINDLPLAVKEGAILFADDAAFVILSQSLMGLYKKIKGLFADLTRYLNMNKLIPNAKKIN